MSIIKQLTIPASTTPAVSSGASYVNANVLQNYGNQLFPVAIQCGSDALTTDTTFVLEWEYATGLWSEIRAEHGASDPKTFTIGATIRFDSMLASFLKDKTIRVKLTTAQAAPRVFTLHYTAL